MPVRAVSPRRPRTRRPARPLAAVVGLVTAGGVAGCGGVWLDVPPAPDAADPGCAQVQVLLRDVDQLGDLERATTSGQSTAAWTDDAAGGTSVVLRCGVAVPGPTTDACLNVDGVDWVAADEQGRGPWTSYGRVPAVEVSTSGDLGADAVLPGLAGALAGVEQQRACS